jgi:alkylation response protein AidB-like acyl-CoA dehydrogenase
MTGDGFEEPKGFQERVADMNFDFSDDQKTLKSEVRRFLDARCPPSASRAVLEDQATSYDAALWTAVADMGWIGAVIPEVYGGAGLGYIELCAIAEELGRAMAPIPFASTVYSFAEALLMAGSDAQKSALAPGLVSGAVIGCLATAESPGALAAENLRARVDDGRLTGAKQPVTDGDIATHAVVLARDQHGPGLFLVDLNARGAVRETLRTLDPSRSAARIMFHQAPCERLGAAGDGLHLLSAVLDRAAVLIAFEQVGAADRCLEMAKEYALGRYAFGRLVASYQAIKHKLADVYVKNELARSHAYFGAWALSANAAEMPAAAAAARLSASSAYDFAAKENVQVHGGMGFTWEADCHLHLRRSRQLGLVLGGPPVWRDRLARILDQSNAA